MDVNYCLDTESNGVTRTHKVNDPDHSAIEGVNARDGMSRFFGKSAAFTDADPKKTKKDGGGKGNWGHSGDEIQDYGFAFTNARRHSNSSTHGAADFRTKFETRDTEPVFEEKLHGASDVSEASDASDLVVTKVPTSSSTESV
ncbi:hypothetical protein N7495_000664 [Penicillium taxi]|uniref:uncharacterized protein n=1 Tax=Penicillium taxi TaxID=168475 RepID=UPI0025457A99|nr:uncharacterized protein N7495_000664 [Penicillium taxi]KAJ5907982.1 hypothetical protein N7495_000664 [Penicillium taxi]